MEYQSSYSRDCFNSWCDKEVDLKVKEGKSWILDKSQNLQPSRIPKKSVIKTVVHKHTLRSYMQLCYIFLGVTVDNCRNILTWYAIFFAEKGKLFAKEGFHLVTGVEVLISWVFKRPHFDRFQTKGQIVWRKKEVYFSGKLLKWVKLQ